MLLSPSASAVQMGFFAEAGPLQVFVSNHLIPESFEFNTAHEPCYQARATELVPRCVRSRCAAQCARAVLRSARAASRSLLRCASHTLLHGWQKAAAQHRNVCSF